MAPTGVAYSNLQGKIELQQDKVHIDNISVLDNHQSALSITGDLAIHELELGGVELFVNSNDFKVIDNKLGNVRVNANLEIAGELRSPRIVGDFGVSTGSVDLDQILALTSDSAYATEQTEYLARADAAAAPAAPSPLDALTMDVRVTVPDDLVIKASELRTPGAPVSLGAINLTLGGDLRATKAAGQQIVLVGTVNTVRGTYDFQGRRFDILRDGTRPVRRRAAQRSRSDSRPAHQPDDSGRRSARQRARHAEAARHRAHQHAAARAGRHPLADRVQPADQLARRRAAGVAGAAGAADGDRRRWPASCASSIGNALGLDTFEINTAPDSGAAASLTIGQQLGQNLYVKVEQGIGGESQTNFILEYELTRWLRLRTNVLQGSNTQQQMFQRAQGSGVDLLFFFSY